MGGVLGCIIWIMIDEILVLNFLELVSIFIGSPVPEEPSYKALLLENPPKANLHSKIPVLPILLTAQN